VSEVPKTYKELLLYALAKAVDARLGILHIGDPQSFTEMVSRYYSAVVALINIASPHLGNAEELLEKADRVWEVFGSPGSPRVSKAARVLDGVLREVVKEVRGVIE